MVRMASSLPRLTTIRSVSSRFMAALTSLAEVIRSPLMLMMTSLSFRPALLQRMKRKDELFWTTKNKKAFLTHTSIFQGKDELKGCTRSSVIQRRIILYCKSYKAAVVESKNKNVQMEMTLKPCICVSALIEIISCGSDWKYETDRSGNELPLHPLKGSEVSLEKRWGAHLFARSWK